MTHTDLVSAAAKWLQKKCSVIVTEIATTGEEPDAIGWQGKHSTLIECKTSRADFLADKQKMFRRQPEYGIGQARYFLVPGGMISVEELPEKWGLLEFRDGKVRIAKESEHFTEADSRHEIGILLSTLRRIGRSAPAGTSIRFYTFETRNRATLGMEVETP